MPTSHSPNHASHSAQRWWASSQPVLDAAHRLARAVDRASYDPNQPRIPAGSSGGGRWTDGAGSDIRIPHADPIPKAPPIRLADGAGTPSPEFIADLKRQIDAADERLRNAILRGSSGIEISHAEIERARLAIAEKALDEVGSTAWAKDKEKPPYRDGVYKCNLFVHDALRAVEADPPLVNGDYLYRWFGIGSAKYPLLAGNWGDVTKNVPGWDIITGSPRPGDVVAVKDESANASGHTAVFVGLDSGSRRTVGAGLDRVTYTGWPWRDEDRHLHPVVRRWRGVRLP